jgi:hypothetical protein
VDVPGSGSCPVVGFGISSVEPLTSAPSMLVLELFYVNIILSKQGVVDVMS